MTNIETAVLKEKSEKALNQVEEREKIKENYYKDSTLMLHESCYWF
jgi:hypothetical protein